MKEIETNTLTASEYTCLRNDVGWGVPLAADAEMALSKSLVVFVKRMAGKAVGSIRIVGDDILCFYIQDLMVLQTHRRKGIGTELVKATMEYIASKAALNAYIGLMAAKGLEGFYERFGFIVRPNAEMGPGMIQFYGRGGELTES